MPDWLSRSFRSVTLISSSVITSRYFCLISLPFLVSSLCGADQWVRLSTPHFELYTSAGEKKGREAILYFEQVRSFFLQASQSKRAPQIPIRIVAFRGEKQYKPYTISEAAAAYYSRSRSHDYIVMEDISSEHYPVAIHEYTHLMIEHSNLPHIPVWLNEGWADLYSTLKPVGKKAEIGDLLPGRAVALVRSPLIPLNILTAVDHNSPLYNEKNRASVFYAESWALVHMLYFTPAYRPNFAKFVTTISSGKSMDATCQSVFGKPMWQVEVDLRNYIQGSRFYKETYDIKLEKSAEDPDVAEVTPFESELLLADLLALCKKNDEARKAYEQLAKNNPSRPEAEESWGYLAWQTGNENEAREHFGRAVANGTKNAEMCFHFAMLQRGPDAILTLQKALDLKPDYSEARLQLGVLLLRQRSYLQALGQLREIKSLDEDKAHILFSALAYSYLETGDLVKARQNAELAKKWAKTPEEIQQAESIIDYADARKSGENAHIEVRLPAAATAPPQAPAAPQPPSKANRNPFITADDKMARVEGIAQKLDCSGDSVLFHVLVGQTNMVFEIPDPDRVQIKHPGEVKHDFSCGQQKPYKVVVDYAVLADPTTGSAGIVRGLEF